MESSFEKMEQRPAAQGKEAHKLHDGKPAPWLLTGGLRIGFLIIRGVRHGDRGAIDDAHNTVAPEMFGMHMGFETFDELGGNRLQSG